MIELRLQSARLQPPVDHPPFHTWTFPDGTLWTEFHRTNGGYLLRFPELADFQVSADGLARHRFPRARGFGNHAASLSQPGAAAGPEQAGQAGVSRQRGRDRRGAVAFVAESGRGKSTLAASFAVSGFRFLTDDGLVVEPGVHGFVALPSHPSIRLWEDSEAALVPPTARRAPPVHYTAKARFLADEELVFCEQPRPLRRVYFLGDGSAATLELHRLTPAEAADRMGEAFLPAGYRRKAPAGLPFRSGGDPGEPADPLPPRLPAAIRGPGARPGGHRGTRAIPG